MNEWNIIKTSNNIEWQCCFTYNKYIFISQKTIHSYMRLNDNTAMQEILLHEYIHILQRYNQHKFDDFYEKYWSYYKLHGIKIDLDLQKSRVTNPDGVGNYIFKSENKRFYLPTLMLSKNTIKGFAIELLTDNRIDFTSSYNIIPVAKIPNYKKTIGLDIDEDLYHPNEIFANYTSKMLLGLKSQDRRMISFLEKNFMD